MVTRLFWSSGLWNVQLKSKTDKADTLRTHQITCLVGELFYTHVDKVGRNISKKIRNQPHVTVISNRDGETHMSKTITCLYIT